MNTKSILTPLKAASLLHFDVGPRRLTLPDTSVELVWVNGRVDVIGPMTIARPSRYTVGTRVVLLTLNPIVAARWLCLPLEVLTDRVIDLDEIDGKLAAHLCEQFANLRVRDLVGSIPGPSQHPMTRDDVAIAHLSRGMRVAQVSEAVNLGERQFTRWFKTQIGMHPKRFQRVIRLRRAVTAAKRGAPLSAAAASCGYADQAHFGRDVKALTGGAPRLILPNVGNVQDIDLPLG